MFATPKSQAQIKKEPGKIIIKSNEKLNQDNHVKESISSLGEKGSVVARPRLPTAKIVPPRMIKGASQLSLLTKQKIRAKPQEFAYSPAASFQEITRLISLNDEQKMYITQLQKEIKTLKIVNLRQEKGLQSIDKDFDEFPKLFKTMNEELRVARMDRQRAMEKVMNLEKQAISRGADYHRQQLKIKELKEKLKKNMNPDFEAMEKELADKTAELEMYKTKYEEASHQLKTLQADRNREITFAKQKNAKLTKELDEAKAETIRLMNSLKEKERTVNTLSIYSRRSNMSETDDEGGNKTHKSEKSRKGAIKEKLDLFSDDEKETAPIVSVSLTSPLSKSRRQSANGKLNNNFISEESEEFPSNQTQNDTLHQRVASSPLDTPKAGGSHQRRATVPSNHDISRSQTPTKPTTPSGKQDPSKYSFFKPNLKASSAHSDGGYSDDFHNDDDDARK